MQVKKGSLTVISGFSGAGKGTIVHELLAEHPEYVVSVSVTTRAPRPGEVDGVDYHFITQEQFDELVRRDGLLEHAGYVSHSYGTPRQFVEASIAQGRDVILEIDVQGAWQIRDQVPDAIFIFIMPPSAGELKRRMYSRGTESEEEIRGRLLRAREEAHDMFDYDYLIVNDDLEEAVEQLHHTIQSAKNEIKRCMPFAQEIRRELDLMTREEDQDGAF